MCAAKISFKVFAGGGGGPTEQFAGGRPAEEFPGGRPTEEAVAHSGTWPKNVKSQLLAY